MSWFQVGLLVLVACGAFAAGVAITSARRHSRLTRVEEAAAELAAGNLAHRVIMPGDDQAARIAMRLNEVADSAQLEREKATSREEAQKRFLANISHDLRTPVTSIAGYVDALERGLGDEPERYLSVIASKTEDLAQLTDDLFYAARIDADDLELNHETLDLAESVRRSVLGFEPQLAASGVRVALDIPDEQCPVYADSSAVMRILSNIISNGIRHSRGMTQFLVSMSCDGGRHTVSVSNDGGSLPDDPSRLFERGVSGPGGGPGLGLQIARELAERSGATLTAGNTPEGHTEFRLDFPDSASSAKFRET